MKLKNILLIVALLGIGIAIFIQCNHYVGNNSDQGMSQYEQLVLGSDHPISCGGTVLQCEHCMRCVNVFALSTIIGMASIFIVAKYL